MQLGNDMRSIIIITEEQLEFIKNKKGYAENNSIEVFNTEVRHFIFDIIRNNISDISDYWRINGISRSDLLKMLQRYGIIVKYEDEESGEIGFKIPRKNFDKKIGRLYYELFPDEEPGLIMTEDGEGSVGDGATSCFSSSGSYEQPLSGVIRRKIANI